MNKIRIEILSYDTQGKLTESVSNTLKQNIANYLSHYRMINDYISITNANVVDLEFELSVVMDSTQNQGQIITNIINSVDSYFSPQKQQLGDNVNISDIRRIVQDIPGVISLSELKVFNKSILFIIFLCIEFCICFNNIFYKNSGSRSYSQGAAFRADGGNVTAKNNIII